MKKNYKKFYHFCSGVPLHWWNISSSEAKNTPMLAVFPLQSRTLLFRQGIVANLVGTCLCIPIYPIENCSQF